MKSIIFLLLLFPMSSLSCQSEHLSSDRDLVKKFVDEIILNPNTCLSYSELENYLTLDISSTTSKDIEESKKFLSAIILQHISCLRFQFFESTTKQNVEIYEVTNLQTGEVEYVGQTTQGTEERFNQHKAEGNKKNNYKKEWNDKTKYKVETVKKGNWTPYEAHVWEQHFLEKNGGKKDLKNKKNAITEGKYDKFADLHNPC